MSLFPLLCYFVRITSTVRITVSYDRTLIIMSLFVRTNFIHEYEFKQETDNYTFWKGSHRNPTSTRAYRIPISLDLDLGLFLSLFRFPLSLDFISVHLCLPFLTSTAVILVVFPFLLLVPLSIFILLYLILIQVVSLCRPAGRTWAVAPSSVLSWSAGNRLAAS